ncbi:MAG TPA: hypothetical protein VJJ79_03135 [Candidatus Nanoarchaeia archaeon]|nr:hypothetical protein [Candidatus Nanoarchaeia archaeon]
MKDPLYIEKKEVWYKQKKFLTIALGIFLISIMVLSAVNLNTDAEEEVTYGGHTFVQTSFGWQTYLDSGQQLFLTTNPEDLASVFVPAVDFSRFSTLQKVYVGVNMYDDVQPAVYDLQRDISLPAQTDIACYEDNDLCANYPLKTCEDASFTVGVIQLQQANETLVQQKGNCLLIQGKDLLMLTDKLILDYYDA